MNVACFLYFPPFSEISMGNVPTLSKSVGSMFPTHFLLVLQCMGKLPALCLLFRNL